MSSQNSDKKSSAHSEDSTGFVRNLAVVVGINRYQNGISPLRTATHDAQTLAQILKKEHGYCVTLLLDEEVSYSALSRLFETQAFQSLGESDRLLFYFAGHGVARDGEDGPMGYLIPQDAILEDATSFVPMQAIHDALTQLRCRHLLAIFDCCFSGAFRWSSLRRDILTYPAILHQERYARFIQAPAWQIITSSAYNQESLDLVQNSRELEHNAQHSPFAQALFDGLRGEADLLVPSAKGERVGDGVITATELYLYLRNRVELLTKDSQHLQTPGLWPLRKHDRGEFIFLVPGRQPTLPPAPQLNAANNPYKGLNNYDEADADLFYGRKVQIAELTEAVARNSLTIVVGASGTGKSSLVKAGVIPSLRVSQPDKWMILPVIRPGDHPLTTLSLSLASLRRSTPTLSSLAPDLLTNTLRQSTVQIATILKTWQQIYPSVQVLLVIDQFEELITVCQDPTERQQFLNILIATLNTPSLPFHLILTLRSDYEPQFLSTIRKLDWINHRYVVPLMTQDELRQAIEGPASEKTIYFEPPALVEQLINDAAQMPGALPLLSFTLSELYIKYVDRQSDNRALIKEDYDDLGGIAGALTQRANQEYHQLVQKDQNYAQTVRHVMLRMVTMRGGEPTRRRVSLDELEFPEPKNHQVQEVIERLTSARLLVSGQDAEEKSYVEPAHDALVQGWDKLQQWQAEDQEQVSLQQLLTPVASAWKRQNEPTGLLWNANPRLTLLKQVAGSPNNWLNHIERQFVQRSVDRRRRNRWTLGGATLFTITIIGIASGIAFFQQNEQKRREIEQLNAQAETRFQNDDQLGALLTGVGAGQKLQYMDKEVTGIWQRFIQPSTWIDTKLKTTITLHNLLANIQEQNRIEAHEAAISDVVFNQTCSNGESFIASASHDATVKLWTPEGRLRHELPHTYSATSVDISHDCQLVLTGSGDGAKLWKPDGTFIRQIEAGVLTDVQISSDGQILATVNDDLGRVTLWHPTGTSIRTFGGKTHELSRVSFSPDNRLIAFTGQDSIQIWSVEGQFQQTLENHNSQVTGASFHPNGNWLISADNSGTINIWHFDGVSFSLKHSEQSAHTQAISDRTRAIKDVSFSPEGQIFASAGSDQTVKLWDFNSFQNSLESDDTGNTDLEVVLTLEGHGDAVTSVSFSREGETIITASTDKTLRYWKTNRISKNLALNVHESTDDTRSASFSPDNQLLVRVQRDGTAELWNFKTGKNSMLSISDEDIGAVAFSPDSKTIASASLDSPTIVFWNSEGEEILSFQDPDTELKEGYFNQIAFSSDGQTLALVNHNNHIKTFNISSQSTDLLGSHDNTITTLKFSPTDRILASADTDHLKIWDLEDKTFTALEIFNRKKQTLQFSPDGQLIAYLGPNNEENVINLWNIETRDLASLEGHRQVVESIRFGPDGDTLASTSRDQTVRLWDMEGQNIRTFIGHNGFVEDVFFHPNGYHLLSLSNFSIASNSASGEIRFWSIDGSETGSLRNIFGSYLLNLGFLDSGNNIIAADVDALSSVMRLNFSLSELIDKACIHLDDYLQSSEFVSRDDRELCDNSFSRAKVN